MDSEGDANDESPEQMEVEEIEAPLSLNSYPSDYLEPPILSYTYSGISNASSSYEPHLQSSRVSEEPSDQVCFFLPDQVFGSIRSLVAEVKESLMLEEDIVLYILYFYKWSKDRLYEEYYDQAQNFQRKSQEVTKFLQSEGQDEREGKGQNEADTIQSVCAVCCQDKKLIKNTLCCHRYCRDCWKDYISTQMKLGDVFFGCMNGCKDCPVLIECLVAPYFPELLETYKKMTCINYTKFNNNISYCPGGAKPCDYFCQLKESVHISIVECVCGNFFCFGCQKEPHFPATCPDVLKWEQTLNKEEGSVNWITQNTVKCPCCAASVQKYIGCSYVKCVCGTEFCYDCCQKWDEMHRLNKGGCLKIKKKSSLQERASSNSFLELQEKVMAINQTRLKHLHIISFALGLIHEDWMIEKFQGVRKEVTEAWLTLKWGTIAQFLYKKEGVHQFIEDEFVNCITNLMNLLERAYQLGRSIGMKELAQLGDQVMLCREQLCKSQTIWTDAWSSS